MCPGAVADMTKFEIVAEKCAKKWRLLRVCKYWDYGGRDNSRQRVHQERPCPRILLCGS